MAKVISNAADYAAWKAAMEAAGWSNVPSDSAVDYSQANPVVVSSPVVTMKVNTPSSQSATLSP